MGSVSIIICTRDRAASLRETLASIGRCVVPPDITAELVVVDNGSRDDTEAVVRGAGLTNLPVRYVPEPTAGLSRARNAGLRATTTDVVLFTDDDVRVPPDWLEGMCRPIFEGRADALAGGVLFPPEYEAMLGKEPFRSRRGWFACTDGLDPVEPDRMVGANMAFSRRVIEQVGEFDAELGAGAMGFFEETVYTWRLQKAGFRLRGAMDVRVEHHFDRERLTRATLLSMARRMGASKSYVVYHWGDWKPMRWPFQMWGASLLLLAERGRGVLTWWGQTALARELDRVVTLEFWRGLWRERGTPRKYVTDAE